MQVSELMTRTVRVTSPDQSIREAAQLMAELDTGVLPVGDNDRLVGMITDRDIALRAVAQGRNPDTHVREVMTGDVKYCFEDEDVDAVSDNMSEQQIRRLVVLNRDKRLVGIISLGDIATGRGTQDEAGEALTGVSKKSGGRSRTSADSGRH
jgi:CBS domain-containing protein